METGLLSSLYISNRKGFIEQTATGWITRKGWLSDKILAQHIAGERTVGVKLGEDGLTKFICFDVDTGDPREIIDSLLSMNLAPLVSFSGSKGYHVELFFNAPIHYSKLRPFFNSLVKTSGIDFRPSGSGVKLPLGIHRGTGHYCSYVDPLTLEPIDLPQNIELIDPSILLIQEEERATVGATPIIMPNAENRVAEILAQGYLNKPHSRHWFTLNGAIWLRSRGLEPEDCLEVLEGILRNAKNTMGSSIEYALNEARRIVRLVYERNYGMTAPAPIKLYDSEIAVLLDIEGPTLKQLYLSLLVYSKRYGKPEFYMSYSCMALNHNTKNRSRLLRYLLELESMGLIGIVSRGVPDPAIPCYYKTNRYVVAPVKSQGKFIEIKENTSLYFLLPRIVERSILKKKLSRREYQNLKSV